MFLSGILHFLRKKEQFFAGFCSDPFLNLKGNNADLHYRSTTVILNLDDNNARKPDVK
jgi:hypothetical protein